LLFSIVSECRYDMPYSKSFFNHEEHEEHEEIWKNQENFIVFLILLRIFRGKYSVLLAQRVIITFSSMIMLKSMLLGRNFNPKMIPIAIGTIIWHQINL